MLLNIRITLIRKRNYAREITQEKSREIENQCLFACSPLGVVFASTQSKDDAEMKIVSPVTQLSYRPLLTMLQSVIHSLTSSHYIRLCPTHDIAKND